MVSICGVSLFELFSPFTRSFASRRRNKDARLNFRTRTCDDLINGGKECLKQLQWTASLTRKKRDLNWAAIKCEKNILADFQTRVGIVCSSRLQHLPPDGGDPAGPAEAPGRAVPPHHGRAQAEAGGQRAEAQGTHCNVQCAERSRDCQEEEG